MPTIITRSGKRFDPWNPDIAMIEIGDAAEALAKESRFNGHTIGMYTVAQHSMLVASHVSHEHKLTALLHDLPEGLGLRDMMAPVKHSLPEYKKLEAIVWEAVAAKFDLPIHMPLEVLEADRRAVATERRDLITRHNWSKFDWPGLEDVEPFPETLTPCCDAYYFWIERDKFLADFVRYKALRDSLRE